MVALARNPLASCPATAAVVHLHAVLLMPLFPAELLLLLLEVLGSFGLPLLFELLFQRLFGTRGSMPWLPCLSTPTTERHSKDAFEPKRIAKMAVLCTRQSR